MRTTLPATNETSSNPSSTSAHTPGPWSVTGEPEGARVGSYISGPEGQYVAVVHGSLRQDWDANARLIAAAPDMLAALQRVLCIQDETYGEKLTFDPSISALDQVRAAIAKATGGA